MRFNEWLETHTVDDVLRAKTEKSDNFLSMPVEGSIWDAMWIMGSNDISAISVFTRNENHPGILSFDYIITINEILAFIRLFLQDDLTTKKLDVDGLKKNCLKLPMSQLVEALQDKADKLKPIFIQRDSKLSALVDIWICDTAYDASHRVLVGSRRDVEDVVTMTDFIHYCFVHAHQLPDIMQAQALSALYPGTRTPSPLSPSCMVDERDTAWNAMQKLLDASPLQVVGIKENSSGTLVGYLSSMDFMPCVDVDQIFEIIASLECTVNKFVRFVTKSPIRLIDSVTFREHMTLEKLIERLLKLRVHMLWRLALTGQVIGVVTAVDVLRYFKRSCDLGY